MESTTHINSAGVTPIIDDALQNDLSKTVEAFAGSGQHREDFAGFSNVCSIHNASVSKGGTGGDNSTSAEESPARKGNVMEAPERVRLGAEHIKAGDMCDTRNTIGAAKEFSNTENTTGAAKEFSNTENSTGAAKEFSNTENTTGAAKEFSNTENKAQSSSYNVQYKQAPQMDRFSLSTRVNCDRTDEHNTDTQPSQWHLSEVTTGIENFCFQTRYACFQTSTANSVLDLSRGALVGCREWVVAVDAEREVEDDSICAHGSNSVSQLNDLACSKTGENTLDDVPRTQRHLPNDENPTPGVVCSTCRDAGNSSDIAKETESSTLFAADNNITAASTLSNSKVSISTASAETGKIYTISTREANISAAAIETDQIYISTPEVNISAAAIETDKIYISTPEVNISAAAIETDQIYISTPEVNISAAAIETDQIYISTPEVNISAAAIETDQIYISTPEVNISAAAIETDQIYISTPEVNIFAAAIETDQIYISTPEVNISAAAIETDQIYISTPEVNISAAAIETDQIYISTPEVNISAAAIETDQIYISTPEVNISAAAIETDKIYISTPEVNISAAAIETDNSSTLSTPKVDMSAHLAGDSRDVINVQRNEIQDCSDRKISETTPDINDREKPPLLENASKNPRSCCPQALVGNYLSKEANSCVNSDNARPGDYTIENALFLVRSYISELERVATNIDRILQSDSSRLEMNKKGCSYCKVSHSEFENNEQMDITGDNLETVAGNISLELSDQLAEEMSTSSVKAVDVKEDIVRLEEDLYHRNEECKPEYVSTTHGEVPAQCSARCDGEHFGLHGDQAKSSRVSSNSQIRGNESEFAPHNVNNNSTCYASANIENTSKHALLTVNANAKNQLLNNNRKMCSIFYPVCAETRHLKGHRRYMNLTANTRFKRVDTIYVNINNNGNTLSSTPRNIALSSEAGSVPTAPMNSEQAGLKTRTQRFRKKLTSPGCDILVFEGSKVYSVTQKASNCQELVGKCVSDAGESKPILDSSDKSQFGLKSPANIQLRGCQSVNKLAEINDGLARQCEKSGDHHDAQEVRQADNNFGTYSLNIPDALRLPGNDKVQSEPDVYLNNNNDDHANQISYSESKHNHSVNVVHDNFEMLKVGTLASAKYQNIINGCQLQPTRNMGYEAEQARQNAKRAKTTKRSRNRAYPDSKHQNRKDKCANDASLLDVVSSAQGGAVNTSQIEPGSSPLPVNCKHCCQTSATKTLPRVNRWASALGSNENRSTDINQIEYQKKRNFPMRIRAASRQSQNDVYIPARTRRLTVESPAENLLVHTSYDRPNPKQLEGVFNIEMANRSNVLYLGAEEDYINTDGTRRLVCETECLSSIDPKTKHLVIENSALNVSCGNIHSVSEETKESGGNGISVAAEEITRTGRELPEVVKNVSDRCIKWCGVSCARMIGDFVVIGTTKSIQSVVNMVHNQIQYSIPAGVNCETLNLPGAGDDGHTVRRQAAVCDRSRGGESGDHLAMAITDNDYINSNKNNNNVCLQGTIIGYNRTQRVHNKVQAPIHGGRHRNMASCVTRMPYSTYTYRLGDDLICVTQTNFSRWSGPDVNIHTVIQIIYQLRNKTMRIIYCRFCGLLLSSSTLAIISHDANRNNSSARENNDWWEVNKNAPKHTNEASTETTDLNSEYMASVTDCERTLACSSCSISDQVTQQDHQLKHRDFMVQVEATDINPTAESQTCDSLQAPSDSSMSLRHSSGRLSLIEEVGFLRQRKKVSCRNCTSCCDLRSSAFKGDPGNQEIETQVQATDINPSNLAQTGKSLITIDSRWPSDVEISKDRRAVSSISVHLLHYESIPESSPLDIFVTKSVEKNSLWTGSNSDHRQQVPVASSETIPQSFDAKQHAGSSYHSLEYTHYRELADEEPVGTITPRVLCGMEMREAGLVWQNNSFVPQQELGVTRSGPDMSVYGHLKSELEFFMNDVDVFDIYGKGSQYKINPTSYAQNTVDHESGGYRVASIPTSSMSLTVLDPTPVYDFTFTKDHWQARYRNRTPRGNSSPGRNVEDTHESDGEDPAPDNTVKDDKVAAAVRCNRQRSEDQQLFKRAKGSAYRPFIIY